MKDIRNIILFVIGITWAYFGIINVYNDLVSGYLTLFDVIQGNGFDTFIGIVGIFLIYYSATSLKLHNNEEEKFNYRITDSDENCLKCKCCNPKSLTDCKFFHIKIDEHHVCDLLGPQIEEEILKEQNNDHKQITDQ
jgi:hypothetical protein